MKVCSKCGATDRNLSGKCVPCQKERSAKWYAENRETAKEATKLWAKANPEKVKESKDKWALANPENQKKRKAAYLARHPERVRSQRKSRYANNLEKEKSEALARYRANPQRASEAHKAWHAANPDKRCIHEENRRARKRAVGGKLSPDLALALYIAQEGKCACCNQPLGTTYHLDHKMPLALGGPNTDDNIQLLLPRCNMSKGAKHPDDWLTQINKAGTVRALTTQTGHPE